MEYMVPQKQVTVRFLKAREGYAKDAEIQVSEGEARRLIDAGWAAQITREGPQAQEQVMAAPQKPQQPQQPQQPSQPPPQPQPPDPDKDQPDKDKGDE